MSDDWELSEDARLLAEKLPDAGLDEDEALAWVRRVVETELQAAAERAANAPEACAGCGATEEPPDAWCCDLCESTGGSAHVAGNS